ncbi:DUF998 domain-containing protein [Candidatus Mycobacterium wuenschmannii]|uniref:DUF998 domain-containing protein n=1 Tax=Candidatus Mycobacterium wuenschmannii TaxID=3027808 RepID=A0ABY8W118_9MYCO|nr:DUF998 domain-containing protein [Candidatus Mycobacterium wuenschmannii]WIM87474.1 DUF998 domain-containing protein [Candidatus Mycobacterium wuenschmannii]
MAGVVWFCGAFAYVALEAVAAYAFQSRYSYAHNFISDLGVPGSGSPLAWLMNLAFCVQGSLLFAGAVALRRTGALACCAAANAVGNLLIAFFHSGSATHAVGAVLAIVGGNATVLAGASIIGAPRHRRVSLGLGVFGLLSFVVFVIDLKSGALPRGLVERCSVYSITVWQLLTGTWLFSRRPTP